MCEERRQNHRSRNPISGKRPHYNKNPSVRAIGWLRHAVLREGHAEGFRRALHLRARGSVSHLGIRCLSERRARRYFGRGHDPSMGVGASAGSFAFRMRRLDNVPWMRSGTEAPVGVATWRAPEENLVVGQSQTVRNSDAFFTPYNRHRNVSSLIHLPRLSCSSHNSRRRSLGYP